MYMTRHEAVFSGECLQEFDSVPVGTVGPKTEKIHCGWALQITGRGDYC
jgi:hypothetical protein